MCVVKKEVVDVQEKSSCTACETWTIIYFNVLMTCELEIYIYYFSLKAAFDVKGGKSRDMIV